MEHRSSEVVGVVMFHGVLIGRTGFIGGSAVEEWRVCSRGERVLTAAE